MLRQVAPGLQSELVHRSASGQPAEMLFPRLPRFRQWVKCANCTQLMTVNRAPADLRKEGPAYDLPIAVGLLMASEQLIADLARTLMIGELSLDGIVRHTNGVLPMAALAHEKGFDTLFVPAIDAPEAALVPI